MSPTNAQDSSRVVYPLFVTVHTPPGGQDRQQEIGQAVLTAVRNIAGVTALQTLPGVPGELGRHIIERVQAMIPSPADGGEPGEEVGG